MEPSFSFGREFFAALIAVDDELVGSMTRYDVLAFSRPTGLIARLGAPIARSYQLRFQRETLETMRGLCR